MKFSKGKSLIIIIISTIIFLEIFTTCGVILKYLINQRLKEAIIQFGIGGVRFMLTLFLLFFLYKGHIWAKWCTIILGILLSLYVTLEMFFYFDIFMLILGVIYLSIIIVLISSNNINEFFKTQRKTS